MKFGLDLFSAVCSALSGIINLFLTPMQRHFWPIARAVEFDFQSQFFLNSTFDRLLTVKGKAGVIDDFLTDNVQVRRLQVS